jgi:hypothetical protein
MDRRIHWKATVTIAAGFLLIIGAGYYYTRWFHYHDRPLFFNTYHPDRDGVVWYWDFLPPPLSDFQGNTVFADFPNNMIAVVRFPAGSDGGSYQTSSSSEDHLAIVLGNKTVVIPKRAQRIYDSISKSSDRTVQNWETTVHKQILGLLQQPTTQASGGT